MTTAKKQVVVIGAGFSGLTAATHLASKASSYSVKILEKNDTPGGRARKFETSQGFVFDMGPSWYWMPDVFDKHFATFGKKPSDYYDLVRLDPSYCVVFGENDFLDVPADLGQLKRMFEELEPGSAGNFEKFLDQAKFNYKVGMEDLIYLPGVSMFEVLSPRLLFNLIRMRIYQSMSSHVRQYFRNPKIVSLLEFPVLFLGGTAQNIPAAYSLMNYVDMVQGTWYPRGGMHEIIKAMVSLAEEQGVEIRCSSEVRSIKVEDGQVKGVELTSGEFIEADIVVASADYHHVDAELLEPAQSNYGAGYWKSRTMAPSCLVFYLGIDKRLNKLRHHNLFFDVPMDSHADSIYGSKPRWPEEPLFYVSAPSMTDPTVAPEGMENLFILIPLAVDLEDGEAVREKYYNVVMDRLERLTGQEIRSHVIFKKSYGHRDFKEDYHAFRGNAYGLANTILQSAVFKPRPKSYGVKNLYYTGQLTVPGPGMPACIISGELVAKQVMKDRES